MQQHPSPDIVVVHHKLGTLAREFGVRATNRPEVADRDPRMQLGYALERLYEALNDLHGGNAGSFREVWSHGEEVTAATAGGGVVSGWEGVRGELEREARDWPGLQVVAEEVRIAMGVDAAWALCTERLSGEGAGEEIRQHSTNIFRRESGEWRLVHRHVSVLWEEKEKEEDRG